MQLAEEPQLLALTRSLRTCHHRPNKLARLVGKSDSVLKRDLKTRQGSDTSQ